MTPEDYFQRAKQIGKSVLDKIASNLGYTPNEKVPNVDELRERINKLEEETSNYQNIICHQRRVVYEKGEKIKHLRTSFESQLTKLLDLIESPVVLLKEGEVVYGNRTYDKLNAQADLSTYTSENPFVAIGGKNYHTLALKVDDLPSCEAVLILEKKKIGDGFKLDRKEFLDAARRTRQAMSELARNLKNSPENI